MNVKALFGEFGRVARLLTGSSGGRVAAWTGTSALLWLVLSLALPRGLPFGVLLLGLVLGGLSSLTAMGLVIIYRSSRIINFAQAQFGTLAATLAVVLTSRRGVSYFIAVLIGVAVAVLAGALVEVTVVKRFFRAPRLILTVATIGVAQVLDAGAIAVPQLINERGNSLSGIVSQIVFQTPFSFRRTIGPIVFTGDALVAALVIPGLLVGLSWFFNRTDSGIGVRGAADSQERALLLGMPVRRLSLVTWCVAAGLSGIAAILSVGVAGSNVSGLPGPEVLLAPLAAAMIARFESLPVAFGASLGIGVFQQAVYWSYPRASTLDAALFVLILLALLFSRQRMVRVAGGDLGGFVAVREVRPVAARVLALPEVRAGRLAIAAIVAFVTLAVPMWISNSLAIVFAFTAIYAIIAVSLVVLTGWAGQVSLGQFAFVGIGAATAASLFVHQELDFFLCLLAAMVVGAMAAVLIGIPALRIPGLFLAPVTLAFAVAVSSFVLNPTYFASFTPSGLRRPIILERLDLTSPKTFYYFCLCLLVAAVALARNFRRTRIGRAVVAARDNERMAAGFSISPLRVKLTAFALSGGLAGLAGGLYALAIFGVPFGGFKPVLSMQVFSMVVVGGLASIFGGVLGAIYVYSAEYLFRGALQLFVTGAGILVVLLFAPGGLAEIAYSVRDRLLLAAGRRRGLDALGIPEKASDESAAVESELSERASAWADEPLPDVSAVPRLYRSRPWLARRAVRQTNDHRYASALRNARIGTIMPFVFAPLQILSGAVVMGVMTLSGTVMTGRTWWMLRREGARQQNASNSEALRRHVARHEAEVVAGTCTTPPPRPAYWLPLAGAGAGFVNGLILGSGSPVVFAVGGLGLGATAVVADQMLAKSGNRRANVLSYAQRHGVTPTATDPAELGSNSSLLAPEALLRCEGVTASYGHLQVLFGVQADVRNHEVVALLGTNGAGKSTTLKLIAGVVEPTGGALIFDGEDVTSLSAIDRVRRGIVLAPSKGIFGSLTVNENLRLAGWIARRDGDREFIDATMTRIFELFPVLQERIEQRAALLSGGEQQMLTIAQALLCRPKLLMIDELSLGLAPIVVEAILDVVRELNRSGMSILVVEQSINLSTTVASRAMFMEKGEVRFSGATSDLGSTDLLRSVFVGEEAGANGHVSMRERVRGPVDRRSSPVLEVRDVGKRFGGVVAVKNLSLEVYDGQFLGIIGSNGAGKTTAFDIISGFTRQDAGTLLLNGFDISSAPAAERAAVGLGRTFQDVRMTPSLTTSETLAVALERHTQVREPLACILGVRAVTDSETDVHARVDEILHEFRLTRYRNAFVSELSTGTRRILELACAAAHRPKVLLLDEPTSGLAQGEVESMASLLLDLQAQLGATILMIEHDVPLVAGLADELVCMHLGEIIARDEPQRVLDDPRVISSYLGGDAAAINRSGPVQRKRKRQLATTRSSSHGG